MRILIINGPNLNLLGAREPGIYGSRTLEEMEQDLRGAFPDADLEFFHSNHEGAMIDRLHQAGADGLAGVVMNPGGYSHTSVALRDAVASIDVPVIEVHLSNIHAREPFRNHSVVAGACAGVIAGLGASGYRLAIQHLLHPAQR